MDEEQRANLGVLLFIPYRYTEDRMFRALQEAGFDDWTLAQCRVFQRIAPDGSRLTDLADQAQITKQSAGVLVDQLERLGYVRRVPDPTDGRARLIVIEERGRRAIEVAAATLDEILAEWKAYLARATSRCCTRSWTSSARSPTRTPASPGGTESSAPRSPSSRTARAPQTYADAAVT
jgi:DNA-binding MarR family transcriptional regulator